MALLTWESWWPLFQPSQWFEEEWPSRWFMGWGTKTTWWQPGTPTTVLNWDVQMFLDVFGRGSIIISFQENAPVNISGRVSGGFRQNTQIHLATNLWEVSIKIFPSLRGGKVNKTCKLVITLPQLTWQVYIPLKNWPFAAAKERIVSLNHQFSGVNSLWKFQGGAMSPESLQNGPLPNRLILAYWLVDDTTQFKNIVVKLDHFPYSGDDNSKNIWKRHIAYLVGGFNPFENYHRQIGSFPSGSGWKFKNKNKTAT